MEKNLNTGLPKKVSYSTDKQLQGKKQVRKDDDTDLPYEEREFNLKFRETFKASRQLASSFRNKEDEANAGESRKLMFGLVRPNQINVEARQPGFIKTA